MSFFLLFAVTDALYLRQLQHLLPTGIAWRTTIVAKTLRKLMEAFAAVFQSAREFIDLVHADRFPTTTRDLASWEYQFGLVASATDEDRRLSLAGAWAAQGGQSPRYLQDTVQAAGFDVYIHEWWEPPNVDPRTPRDPRTYTTQPLIGTTQCGESLAQCGESLAQCNRFLANEPGYLVNLNLADVAPPPVPADPATWRYFIYWGGETFPDTADVPADRRAEFERLILKLSPANNWLVTLVNYV
jgi:hypothetical protein